MNEPKFGEWQPIGTAPKDGTPIWAHLREDIFPTLCPHRSDLERWNGRQVPLIHRGFTPSGFDVGWSIAAPVGHGGFPDEWIDGWMPLPTPPSSGWEEDANRLLIEAKASGISTDGPADQEPRAKSFNDRIEE